MMDGPQMSELDGEVKVPETWVCCPVVLVGNVACAWKTPAEPPAAVQSALLEYVAPGQFAPSSKGYAAWYAHLDKTVHDHLESAHSVEQWLHTLHRQRTAHAEVLERLHREYGARSDDLAMRLMAAEEHGESLKGRLLESARRVCNLEEEVEEAEALTGRLGWLLTEVANVLKGGPPESGTHDWSDLPECARELVAGVKESPELVESAWALIASAGTPQGVWSSLGGEWQQAAIKWRQQYHRRADYLQGGRMMGGRNVRPVQDDPTAVQSDSTNVAES